MESPSKKAAAATIKTEEWFRNITGVKESEWSDKEKQTGIVPDEGNSDRLALLVKNAKTGEVFKAGAFHVVRLGALIESLPETQKETPLPLIRIITRSDSKSIPFVDVGNLQSLPENKNAVFQVASNFNAVECIAESSSPDGKSFTTDYIYDRTQGPAASISAGAAAITRVHAAYYDPLNPPTSWRQTATHQVNFLSALASHFPVRNGYVVLKNDEPDFPSRTNAASEYDELLRKTNVGFHKEVQVTTGSNLGSSLKLVNDQEQVIDQVFAAAMNMSQGSSGYANSRTKFAQDKCSFCLDSAYQGTYLCALVHQRKTIYLTLIGGGVFGNSKSEIYAAILRAHLRWANNERSVIETVNVVCFGSSDESEGWMTDLRKANVPFEWVRYTDGVPKVIHTNQK